MYEYLIDVIQWSGLFGPAPEKDYRELIDQRAREGWRLVQVLDIWSGGSRRPAAYHPIFERPRSSFQDATSIPDSETPR